MSINERKGGIYLSIPKLSICVSNKNFDKFEELFVSIYILYMYVFRDIYDVLKISLINMKK